jgi:hypothetical protein
MGSSIHASDFKKMPFWFNGLNHAWKITYPLGSKIRLEKDDLIRSARKNTGMKNLGKDFWEEPLERLIQSINEEANLHPIGRFITKQRLVNLLATRLQAEWWFRKKPEILDQPLYPVFMIAGLQRTGTTKLQRLLAADPDTRSLLSWEALNPSPPVQGKDMRIAFAKTSEKALKYMAPGFFAIHPVEHQAQEEDILLLDVSFLSTTAEATMHVPSYAAWLEETDQSPAYMYGAKLLKLLQWQRPGKYWVLKSPHHLEFLEVIDKSYGDVNYLWTHRDLKACIPSFLSMLAHGQAIFSDQVIIDDIKKHWMNKTRYMLDKAMNFRKSVHDPDKFIDIQYDEFIADPIKILKDIYLRTGRPMDEKLEDQLTLADKKNSKGKYGAHKYSLNDFGISQETISSHYIDYLEYFNKLKDRSNYE